MIQTVTSYFVTPRPDLQLFWTHSMVLFLVGLATWWVHQEQPRVVLYYMVHYLTTAHRKGIYVMDRQQFWTRDSLVQWFIGVELLPLTMCSLLPGSSTLRG